MSDRFYKLLATFFYVGYFPFAPGSVASLLGAYLCFLLHNHLLFYISAFILLTFMGLLASDRVEKLEKMKDPSCIVIDEVAGAMIAFFLLPMTVKVIVTAFFLYRAFDMFKIYPADELQEIKGGLGVMSDDLIAGLYTNLIMHTAIWLLG